MPKLDTTLENLERKSNKVVGTTPHAEWTDDQYPSAKTLYNTYNKLLDITHPVGSLLTTSTNVNPAETVGGTWELVDKAFKTKAFSVNETNWLNAAGVSFATNGVYVTLIDHTVSMRLHLKNTAQLTDTTNNAIVGKLAISACGASRLEYAVFGLTTICDSGNSTIGYNIDSDGTISISDIINIDASHNLAIGNDFYLNLSQPIRADYMLDDFCDKFYWKRTA